MIDLHCHILPAIDDGAPDLTTSLAMARAFVEDGVEAVACTPHILPGVYPNSGPAIRASVAALQTAIDREEIPLKLLSGADNHIVPDFAGGLRSGHLLPLAESRYVLVEPPHHVAPPRLEELFFNIQVVGYIPILTHPERLTWINTNYDIMERLSDTGTWMQVTAGSLSGRFGRNARYWAERMLDEGRVHILATDSHDVSRRPPLLSEGRDRAAQRVGDAEATNLVSTRPRGIVSNLAPGELPPIRPNGEKRSEGKRDERAGSADASVWRKGSGRDDGSRAGSRIADRLRRIFG